jgi:hypothetical protein
MGKLLFVNTNRTNGIFGMIVCAGAIAAGIWFSLGGTYAWILLVPAGLFGGKFFLKLATLRSELYEQGFIAKSCFDSVSGRYSDLKAISRFAVRRRGVLNTHIYLVTQSGERATIIRESLGNDDKMWQLMDYACKSLAGTWMKTLDRQKEVVWIVKGTTPILRIRKDGIVFQGRNGADEFIALNELQLKVGFLATVDICRGDTKVLQVNPAESNCFVGEMLIAMLLENQQRPAVTESADPVRRAMVANATN